MTPFGDESSGMQETSEISIKELYEQIDKRVGAGEDPHDVVTAMVDNREIMSTGLAMLCRNYATDLALKKEREDAEKA